MLSFPVKKLLKLCCTLTNKHHRGALDSYTHTQKCEFKKRKCWILSWIKLMSLWNCWMCQFWFFLWFGQKLFKKSEKRNWTLTPDNMHAKTGWCLTFPVYFCLFAARGWKKTDLHLLILSAAAVALLLCNCFRYPNIDINIPGCTDKYIPADLSAAHPWYEFPMDALES